MKLISYRRSVLVLGRREVNRRSALRHSSIPKGLCPPAQGCSPSEVLLTKEGELPWEIRTKHYPTLKGLWHCRILLYVFCLVTLTALGQSPVTITIEPQATGPNISSNFVGLSFGMKSMLPNAKGMLFFSPTNQPLIILIQNLGVTHLRMGGTSVESPISTPIPGKIELDNLFAFARAAGVKKLIYSLRLLQPRAELDYASTNAAIAKYIWDNYRSQLDCFALGNEPDLQRVYDQDLIITNFSTYISQWRKFAAAVTKVVPEAKFAGPDAGSGNISWTTHFATAEKNSDLISAITEHFYVGGAGRGVTAPNGIEAILSPERLAANQTLYDSMAAPVFSAGLPLRFTEANDHYSGGVPGASDTFAGALWALDFLHWWAAHGVSSVDFHNTQWVVNDVITPDSEGHLTINPKGYGLRAFELGSHGRSARITLSNADNLNLTAYAVNAPKNKLVTVINKEHGPGARSAKVSIMVPGFSGQTEVIYLNSPNNNVTAKSGVTLGGGAIDAGHTWQGQWAVLKKSGPCAVTVPATSAAIVKLSLP